MIKMKDLIQEGRKIQETFKTNVVTEVSFPKTKEEVEKILKKLDIPSYRYKINTDLTVDVNGSVWIAELNLTRIPVQFGKVSGEFMADYNILRSLKGSPKEVGGGFWCADNELRDLEGAPQKVGGDFKCANNKLRTLKGAPQKVGKRFDCSGNDMTSLEGAPQKVGGDFDCGYNKLTSLKGAPKQVGGVFQCYNNPLPDSEKEWAKKNIKAKGIEFE